MHATPRLVRPAADHLADYRAELERGWSADTVRGATAAQEELARIAADPTDFLAGMHDPQALGPPVTLADGTQRPRQPGLRYRIWSDDGFAGSINLRWVAGGGPLPPHVLGHIGYAIVPWRRQQGHATRALALLLPIARAQGLASVDLTSDPDNEASHRVIRANGGVLIETFDKGPVYGHQPGLRFRIALGSPSATTSSRR